MLITFETLHAMKGRRKRKFGDVEIKIDISKAYDRVDWRFLDCILKKMGFCDVWLKWMQLCIHTVSYLFFVNDELVGPLYPGRDLRHVDLLSPYLFILCAEGLSSLLHRENQWGNIHGSRVDRRVSSISHLLFADDSLLFSCASKG